jgi:UDP-N-acetylmuramate--alanine ligase
VVTNIDREHLDHYQDIDAIRQAFVYFANRVPFYGVSILCVDDPQVREILPRVTKRTRLYGTRPEAEIRAEPIRLEAHGSRFVVHASGHPLGEVTLQVPGRHNVLNALAAVAVGVELEIAFAHIAESLAEFTGVGRRFETRGTRGGVRVVDDYGHHPTEIDATLSAARGLGGRLLVLFQPHRYTRTAALAPEFGAALLGADRVWVLDVYAAGEAPIAGVGAPLVVEEAIRRGHPAIQYAPDPGVAAEEAAQEARPGDLVLTLGAGDVWRLGDAVLDHLGRAARVGGVRG